LAAVEAVVDVCQEGSIDEVLLANKGRSAVMASKEEEDEDDEDKEELEDETEESDPNSMSVAD
jgi:hypothetical protein